MESSSSRVNRIKRELFDCFVVAERECNGRCRLFRDKQKELLSQQSLADDLFSTQLTDARTCACVCVCVCDGFACCTSFCQGRPGLFEGITFHFRGEFGTTGSPPLSELEPMLLVNGGKVVKTIRSLFTRPTEAGGEGEGRRGSGGGGGSGSGSGEGGSGRWRPRRVVIFQPSSASPAKDARALQRELVTLAEVDPSPQSTSSESARSGSGSGSGGRGGAENMAVEVVKPIWLVDSVGCFRVLKPTVQHRLPTFGGES